MHCIGPIRNSSPILLLRLNHANQFWLTFFARKVSFLSSYIQKIEHPFHSDLGHFQHLFEYWMQVLWCGKKVEIISFVLLIVQKKKEKKKNHLYLNEIRKSLKVFFFTDNSEPDDLGQCTVKLFAHWEQHGAMNVFQRLFEVERILSAL